MAEPGFRHTTAAGGGEGLGRGRYGSPDSIVDSVVSSVSLFTSPSTSMDRCSFVSGALDRDSPSFSISQNSAGNEFSRRHSLSGPVRELPEAKKVLLVRNAKSPLIKNAEIDKVHMFRDSKIPSRVDEEAPAFDSATISFSSSLREFQAMRSRSEAPVKKGDRRRPTSLDLNYSAANVVNSSPRFAVIKKSMASARLSSNFPSPVTPSYHHGSVNLSQGGSSERVSLQSGAATGQVGTTVLPFSNGRTLPFKWEDAERWIFCPVDARDCAARPSYQQPKRQQKSKSGPLGPHGIAHHSIYSPPIRMYNGRDVENLIAASSFSAGVLMADSSSVLAGENNESSSRRGEPCIVRSANLPGCKDLVCQSFETSSRDKVIEDAKNTAANVSCGVSSRGTATQMSPVGGSRSSSMRRLSFGFSTPSTLPIIEVQSVNSLKPQVKDVQVDERVTVTRWSKKHKPLISGKASKEADDWKLKAIRSCSSALDVSERSNCSAKTNRVEDKITAWENLQKEKAEVAIQKLEMKLEKRKSTSIDKIMNKLRSAQRKAQEMRSSVPSNQVDDEAKTPFNPLALSKTRQLGSLSGCFTCHAF